MLRENDLKPCEGMKYYFTGESVCGVSLDAVQEALTVKNENVYALPIKFGRDTVKHGGLLNSTTEECLTIVNQEHPNDYFQYCVLLHKQGGRRVDMLWYYYGHSELTYKKNREKERSKSISGSIMNMLTRVNETDVDAEYGYYDELEKMIQEVF